MRESTLINAGGGGGNSFSTSMMNLIKCKKIKTGSN